MGNQQIGIAAELIRHARQIVAFTGAGISTPSGIPDFRSPQSGLWHDVDPMAVASLVGFRQNPQAFFDWIYPLTHLIVHAQPNLAHLALAQLERYHKLHAIITQNIDMLHARAGNSVIHELHGHLREATCIHCFTVYQAEPIIARFLQDRRVPICQRCGHVVKPNVILFGEQLPVQPLIAAQNAARQCDLMIIIGSSLEVAPASGLPVLAKRAGARLIIINLEPTPADEMAEVVIRANVAEVLPEIVACLEKIL